LTVMEYQKQKLKLSAKISDKDILPLLNNKKKSLKN